VLLAALVLTPMLSRLLAMAPFPARDLTWMALAPVLILLADDGRKRWLQRHG
jgi:hypothetical protein